MKENENEENNDAKVLRIEKRELIQGFVSDLSLTQNCWLQLLSLPNCDLEHFDVILRQCPSLEWLDLSQNLIDYLPSGSAFACAKKLKLLNLHNNGVHTVKCLLGLSYCPGLIGLTLYNTPIASRKGYRHHMLNTVYTLKALDHFIASDQELIEDANFKNHDFRPFGRNFRINLLPPLFTPASLFKIIHQVTHVMCHFSPVTLIQRVVRGHLVRRRMSKDGRKFRPASVKARGRDLLPEEWKFEKGSVKINERKLRELLKHDDEAGAKDFWRDVVFPDLHKNSVEDGLYGKATKITDAERALPFEALRRKQAHEIEKRNLEIYRDELAENALEEKTEKLRSWKADKNAKRNARQATSDILRQVSRSIDAAKAIESAYSIRDKKAKHAKVVQRKNKLKEEEAKIQDNIEHFKETYRINAATARKAERSELIEFLEGQSHQIYDKKHKLIKEIREEKIAKNKSQKWKTENQRKFSEYYIKLEKEIIKYNVRINREQYVAKCRDTSQRVREDLELGKDRKFNLLAQDMQYYHRYNNRYRARLQNSRNKIREKIEKRTLEAHEHVNTRTTREAYELPFVEPA